MKKRRNNLLYLSLSLNLTTLSLFLIGRADHWLQYSKLRDTITDALRSPGGLIAGLIYPYGIHTGGGAGAKWAFLAFASNFIVYVLFWYACLRLADYLCFKKYRVA
jgi:hypothetical protein